jgi:type II secretory pathway pseudopilin PulG
MMSPDDPRLTAYAMNELSPEERAEVEAELAASEPLRRALEEIRASMRLVSDGLKQEQAPRLDEAHRQEVEVQISRLALVKRHFWTASRVAALVALTISAIWLTQFGLTRHEQRSRMTAATALIGRIHHALEQYRTDFGQLPPDTGYGLAAADPKQGAGRTYDAGSLWRYLAHSQKVGDRTYGPYLSFNSEELVSYKDPQHGNSFYVVDPWGTPIGYIGDSRRVIHNAGAYDIFSAGPDRRTAQDLDILRPSINHAYDGTDNDGDGIVDNAEELGPAAFNGSLTLANASFQSVSTSLDDLNNWDLSRD